MSIFIGKSGQKGHLRITNINIKIKKPCVISKLIILMALINIDQTWGYRTPSMTNMAIPRSKSGQNVHLRNHNMAFFIHKMAKMAT